MPELPEGTINAFIQNKNLAKYGLLKDNEGGFLAENFVGRGVPSQTLHARAAAPSTRERSRRWRGVRRRLDAIDARAGRLDAIDARAGRRRSRAAHAGRLPIDR